MSDADGKYKHLLHPRFKKGSGADLRRAPRSINIVHQKDPFPFSRLLLRLECSPQIFQALCRA